MNTGRLEARFAALAREDRAAFVAYLVAGDPDGATSLAMVRGLAAVGADIVELGYPFSDPMAEGPPIQKAQQRALAAGMTLRGVLDLATAFRRDDARRPKRLRLRGVVLDLAFEFLWSGRKLFAA